MAEAWRDQSRLSLSIDEPRLLVGSIEIDGESRLDRDRFKSIDLNKRQTRGPPQLGQQASGSATMRLASRISSHTSWPSPALVAVEGSLAGCCCLCLLLGATVKACWGSVDPSNEPTGLMNDFWAASVCAVLRSGASFARRPPPAPAAGGRGRLASSSRMGC